MKITQLNAKSLLITQKSPGHWFGVKYNMNIYRGCQHRCIYCDSRSACYQIEDFDGELIVKSNAPLLLEAEIRKKRAKGIIGTGAMSDPYTPFEKESRLTRKCLAIIKEHNWPVQIITKSNLILRDADILSEINGVSVAFTLTTTDDDLAAKIEPGAPRPSKRLEALGVLSALGVTAGVTMMPVLPFLEDSEENIAAVVKQAKHYGASYIIPAFGLTMRDRQREYFYQQLDRHYEGLSERYRKRYKDYYSCGINNNQKLSRLFYSECARLGIETKHREFANKARYEQLAMKL